LLIKLIKTKTNMNFKTKKSLPNSKENPFSWGAKYTGVGKFAIFD